MGSSVYPCFFLEPIGRQRLYLRRYSLIPKGDPHPCPLQAGEYSTHDARVLIGEVPVTKDAEGYINLDQLEREYLPPLDDPRWPARCGCGYAFGPGDTMHLFRAELYRRRDTGEQTTMHDAPPGALWYATWLENSKWDYWRGPDGHVLMCKTPGGDWNIDSRASNCTKPNDQAHRCWVRHGSPEDPSGATTGQPLHVDKNGLTCAAGAGSILCGSYHGFLHHGALREC